MTDEQKAATKARKVAREEERRLAEEAANAAEYQRRQEQLAKTCYSITQ